MWRPADEVWAVVGDPAGVQDWFTGIASSTVEGDTRVVVTDAGLPMPETIVTVDNIQRRFSTDEGRRRIRGVGRAGDSFRR